jgi:hypothetical protein
MSENARDGSRKIAFAIVGVGTVIGALVLILLAAFPYLYAESGSARYAREHRIEAIGEVIAAAVLLWIAWQFIRRSVSARSWTIVVGVLVAVAVFRTAANYVRVPRGIRAIGGNWRVVAFPQPGEIDTIFFDLYYKRGAHYQRIAGQVGEYAFVSPDCVTYRGLKVVGRPMHAMCGYRMPVETYDTTTAESELLSSARSSPSYRGGWW